MNLECRLFCLREDGSGHRRKLNGATFGYERGFGRTSFRLVQPSPSRPGPGLGIGGTMRVLGTFPIVLALLAFPSVACAQQSMDRASAQVQSEVLDKIISQEQAEMESLRQYSPLVETYVQLRRADKRAGAAPSGDKYFLGRA